jgi:hypothetical protein
VNLEQKEERGMKKLTMDIGFLFDGGTFSNTGCGACGRRYRDHYVPVPFSGWRGEEYGEKYAMNGVFYFCDVLCGDCLLSSPAELAAKIRTRAEQALRKPNTRRKQRVEAEGMIEFAGELEKVGDLRDLPDGIMAVKIGEAYQEIKKPRPHRARKAA